MRRLVRIGILAALALPFVLFSLASSDALRESKVFVEAIGAALALAGLARQGAARPRPTHLARIVWLGLGAALALGLVSACVNAAVVDPLTAAAVLAPLALLWLGWSRAGQGVFPSALRAMMAAGAFTGALAALQRWGGLFRMPLDSPEPRFLAAGLIGNAGDVGMALVIPCFLLFAFATGPGEARTRLSAAAGLVLALAGLAATESIGPALALGAATLLWVLLDSRKRRLGLAALAAAALLAAATGTGRRILVKIAQVRSGDVTRAMTQRDIGLLAAREMVRARPLLGGGPGTFSNRFVPSRLAAEQRTGRRLVHLSGSAHFDNAHSDPVTLAAEIGIPAALAASGALLALFCGLLRERRRRGPRGSEADLLFSCLFGFALLALGDFPIRIAVAAGPAAFLAGVGLRRIEPDDDASAPSRGAALTAAGAAALLVFLAGGRLFATLAQADGERLLRDAATAPDDAASERAELLSASGTRLSRTLSIRPRAATALLALGSVRSLQGDADAARALYVKSIRLEERAESDLNLGRAALALGNVEQARQLFARSVWIQPRLLDAIPLEERSLVGEGVARAEAALAAGGNVPPLPPTP